MAGDNPELTIPEEAPKPRNLAGRPTSYDPDMCEQVIKLGSLGKSKAQIAGTLLVSRKTLYEWATLHPQFSDALDIANELSQQWWEDQAQAYMLEHKDGEKLNTGIWGKSMSARFPKDYRESIKQEISGPEGGAIPVTAISWNVIDAESGSV